MIPGAGHAVTGNSRCADAIVASWLRGRGHAGCPRLPLFMTPLGSGSDPARGRDGRALRRGDHKLAVYTLHEAEAMSLTAAGLKTVLAGLAGGALHPDRNGGSRLMRYSDIAGVTLDGYVAPDLPATASGSRT